MFWRMIDAVVCWSTFIQYLDACACCAGEQEPDLQEQPGPAVDAALSKFRSPPGLEPPAYDYTGVGVDVLPEPTAAMPKPAPSQEMQMLGQTAAGPKSEPALSFGSNPAPKPGPATPASMLARVAAVPSRKPSPAPTAVPSPKPNSTTAAPIREPLMPPRRAPAAKPTAVPTAKQILPPAANSKITKATPDQATASFVRTAGTRFVLDDCTPFVPHGYNG